MVENFSILIIICKNIHNKQTNKDTMKYAFAACLIAAVSTAHLDCAEDFYEKWGPTGDSFCCMDEMDPECYCVEGDFYNDECINVPTPFQKFKDLFELNEDGRWQIKNMPDLPQLSWNDVDPVEVESWFEGKMELQSE